MLTAPALTALLPLLPELKEFAAKQGVFAVKIEPEILEQDETKAQLVKAGLVRTRAVQPNVSTVIIDLSPTLDEIMAAFNQKGRHAIHRAERDGVTAQAVELTDENMKIMFDLLTETAADFFRRRGFMIIQRESIPADILASSALGQICPASSKCLELAF